MSRPRIGFRSAAVAVLLFALAKDATVACAQSSFALADLTMPPARLPAGCALTPSPSEKAGGNRVRGGLLAGLPSNPWIGTEPTVVASIHAGIIDPPPIPDGPPPTRGELAQFRLRLAEGVEEAYAAVYTDGGSRLITVHAVRYADDSRFATQPTAARARPDRLRLRSGRTAVVVSGEDGPCLQAVGTHVKALAGQ